MDNRDFIIEAKRAIKDKWTVDTLIKRLVELVDQTSKAENILFKAVYDLFFLYYPEAGIKLEEKERFIEEIKNYIDRDDISKHLGSPKESMGYDLTGTYIEVIKDGLKEISDIRLLINSIENKIDDLINKNYPNSYAVLTGMITARLISIAGSMQELAMMPSSKIQILGTESTMFIKGRRTPKYGVIFKHKLVQSADDNLKGKIAKVVASCGTLAIKTDIFSKEDKKDAILSELNRRVDKILGNRKGHR
ncbi:MAG: hypothetical protein OH316_00430 [Candidatus Parvarchaeota archaeon]|nr:hypothetical protein [Candidatus Parvarchaeota archaeon]